MDDVNSSGLNVGVKVPIGIISVLIVSAFYSNPIKHKCDQPWQNQSHVEILTL